MKQKLTFAVTGHRDLIDEDIVKLKEVIKSVFSKYIKRFPNREVLLISALAEGADMLVADVAKELGVSLMALLPFEKDLYIKDFSTKDREKFEELYNYATIKKCLPCNPSNTNCYKLLGYELVDNSDILIALWDGVYNGKEGGTSDVVKYKQEKDDFKEEDLIAIKVKRKGGE